MTNEHPTVSYLPADPERRMWVEVYRGLGLVARGLNAIIAAICKRWLIKDN